MAGRGRPRRNPWDVMRMQRVYDLFCFEKGEHPITYYDMGKRLHKALTELGEAVSPHTCMAVARKMRKGLYARELLSIVVYGIVPDVSFAAMVMPPVPLPSGSLRR